MKFLKVEWTKKRGAIALFATALAVSSFIVGGYVATGNWNPWGNRHYYQVLNANFQECHTVSGATTCETTHNVLFNTGAQWVQQASTQFNSAGCVPSATCGMDYIAMSANTVTPVATDASTGATNGQCGGTATEAGTEITTNGFAAAKATTITDVTGASGAQEKLVITFTDASAATTVAKSCVENQAATGAARVTLATAVFPGGAITLQVNDQITITWTITWTWS